MALVGRREGANESIDGCCAAMDFFHSSTGFDKLAGVRLSEKLRAASCERWRRVGAKGFVDERWRTITCYKFKEMFDEYSKHVGKEHHLIANCIATRPSA